jgi:hypothetical protein
LENEKVNHGRELARVKSDLEFETEQIRKKAEAEKQGLVLQYEGLLQKGELPSPSPSLSRLVVLEAYRSVVFAC